MMEFIHGWIHEKMKNKQYARSNLMDVVDMDIFWMEKALEKLLHFEKIKSPV